MRRPSQLSQVFHYSQDLSKKKKDNDSGHGPSTSNQVRDWNGLKTFNCPISLIENAWLVPKMEIKIYPYLDIDTRKTIAVECWDKLSKDDKSVDRVYAKKATASHR